MPVKAFGMTRSTLSSVVLSLAMGAALSMAACTSVSETLLGGGGNGGGGSGGSGGSGGTADQSGVPCDVAKVLADRCLSCHGGTPSGGAPMPLVTYEELTAPSKKDPAQTVIQRCVARMQDAAAPMPTGGLPPASEVAVLQTWIDAGTPKGDCGTMVEDPFANPVGCLSGKNWNPNGPEGNTMNPGKACIACHKAEGEGPIFRVAGTVYASGHETDYCYGINGATDFSDVRVEITDANGVVSSLKVGSTGNFSLSKAGFAYPYKAKVTSSKGERVMNAEQTSGDCNTCHTQDAGGAGSMAPGRIVVPL